MSDKYNEQLNRIFKEAEEKIHSEFENIKMETIKKLNALNVTDEKEEVIEEIADEPVIVDNNMSRVDKGIMNNENYFNASPVEPQIVNTQINTEKAAAPVINAAPVSNPTVDEKTPNSQAFTSDVQVSSSDNLEINPQSNTIVEPNNKPKESIWTKMANEGVKKPSFVSYENSDNTKENTNTNKLPEFEAYSVDNFDFVNPNQSNNYVDPTTNQNNNLSNS